MNTEYKKQQMQRFSWAETRRFLWQTGHPYVSLMEKKLLEPVADMPGERVLEVGCGEAANIINLTAISEKRQWTGADFSLEKIGFCNSHKTGTFLCADALNLPFKNNSFDTVFARDLLHHISEIRNIAVQEMIRVCRRGGTIILIEANGKKLIYKLLSVADRSESGLRRSNPGNMRALLQKYHGLIDYNIVMKEPSVLFRLIFHYRMGISGAGFSKLFQGAMNLMEHLAEKVCPRDRWGYMVVIAQKK